MSEELNPPMSQSNDPLRPIDPNKKIMTTKPSKPNYNWMYGAIIALLLGTNVYLFMNKNKIASDKENTESKLVASDSSLHAMKTEYDDAVIRLDNLTGKNAQLDSELNNKNSEIAKMKAQIAGILSNEHATEADLKNARKMIASLNGKVSGYEQRIKQLEGENRTLTAQRDEVTHQRDSTVSVAGNLQQKVKLASVLHASNIRIETIHLKRNGTKEKETSKARKVDILRVTFDIDENRITESGNHDIFVSIVAPNGNTLGNAANSSGTTTGAGGESVNYSIVKNVNLQQNTPVRNVSIDWKEEGEYTKGDYRVDIYNEGYKIGSGSVTLR